MRIAIAGFQHETNTFAPGTAGVAEFQMADSWPGLLCGDAVIDCTRGMNLPIAGAAIAAVARNIELIPILWCAAEPSGPVTDEAFDWVSQRIIDGVTGAGTIDGLYLDLHGAMVTQSHQDGEGELLKRLRTAAGDIPIGVSLDLHANVSPAMVDAATLMTIYRTYPHLDMADTGRRCMQHLIKTIEGHHLASAFRQLPFLIPLHAQYTGSAPCQDLYRLLDQFATPDEWVDLAMGFTAADIYDCGPSIVAYGADQVRAQQRVDEIYEQAIRLKNTFNTSLLSPADAVKEALANTDEKPVVIADVQDNPGAGGTSDTTGLLQALISAKVNNAILGVMCDPGVATLAHRRGKGAIISASLGAKSGLPEQQAINAQFRVLELSDGQISYTGEMYGGGVAALGSSCLLAIEDSDTDMRVVVSSLRIQCLDQALFTHFGIELSSTRIICVKSTVHYRADFEKLAGRIVNAAAPGAFNCKLSIDHYSNIRAGVQVI